jgi:hypothetical protein
MKVYISKRQLLSPKTKQEQEVYSLEKLNQKDTQLKDPSTGEPEKWEPSASISTVSIKHKEVKRAKKDSSKRSLGGILATVSAYKSSFTSSAFSFLH